MGQKRPNPWGLYDVYGNVDEWVEDWYDNYQVISIFDPKGPSFGSYRVHRGGGWYNTAENCRSARRRCNPSDCRDDGLGIRVGLSFGE